MNLKRNKMKIGITERGDASNLLWLNKIDKVDGAILITKNPTDEFINAILPYQNKIIIHTTITGYGGTIIESNIPKPESIYLQFKKIVKLLGKEKTVLRIDPIIPTIKCTQKSLKVYNDLKHFNTRVRISFMDNYPHVVERFKKARLEPLKYKFHAPYMVRREIYSKFDEPPEVCGEPDFECYGCVSYRDVKVLNLTLEKEIINGLGRAECKCLINKTELLSEREQCPYKCLYCYWK